MGACWREPGAPFFCMVWGRFRVDAFYMKWNNGPKVSNLTVGHHQFIPLPTLPTKGAPLLASFAPCYRGYLNPIF